jgi:hypothetical protein
MLLNSLHSDKTGERALHSAVPILISASAVGDRRRAGRGPVTVVLLAVALVALNAMGPTFWCLPRAVLQGTAAAGGIALINAVGNLGGFAGPNVLGFIKNNTGKLFPGAGHHGGGRIRGGGVAGGISDEGGWAGRRERRERREGVCGVVS